MSVTDSLNMGTITLEYARELIGSIPDNGGRFIILTLIGLFVAAAAGFWLRDKINYAREKEEREYRDNREDKIRAEETKGKERFAGEIKGLIQSLSGKLDAGFGEFRDKLHSLDKRVVSLEARHEQDKDPA